MKANELMIGDWVYGCTDPYETDRDKKKYPVKVIRIDADGDTMTEGENPFTEPYEDEWWNLEPIPLTPEILEKNGFVQNPRSKSRRSHQICTDSVYISWWRGRLNILFKPFIGHSANHVNVDGKYVHELQHALRICGIEKEIVL